MSTFTKEVDVVDDVEQGRFAFGLYTDDQLRSVLNRSMAHLPRVRQTEIRNDGASDDFDADHTYTDEQLRNVLTNTMSIPPELFEKLYLQPHTNVKGDLRKKVANPTPLAIMGFAIALFPLSIELMAWRGSGAFGTPTTTVTMFFGGMLLILGGLGEFILGNTFSFLVFFAYGAHFLAYATTFMPKYAAIGFASGGDPYKMTPTFEASYGFYALAMCLLSLVFLICSVRTNGVLVSIFVCATMGFAFDAAGLWYTANGATRVGTDLTVACGAIFFVADMLFWYLLMGMLITIMELPLPDLPVLDMSTMVKARPRPA